MDFELEDSKANNHDSGKGSNPFFVEDEQSTNQKSIQYGTLHEK
ncbi:MAG: hypothetical protein QGI53_00530 [SAR324 cluster bacterium]|jgi:hypothetical protein|nr:hypothetical protein [SAR324 cluster bacterium]MDP7437905.1 hypothetical protein [SAR324 cluster bacterium]